MSLSPVTESYANASHTMADEEQLHTEEPNDSEQADKQDNGQEDEEAYSEDADQVDEDHEQDNADIKAASFEALNDSKALDGG